MMVIMNKCPVWLKQWLHVFEILKKSNYISNFSSGNQKKTLFGVVATKPVDIVFGQMIDKMERV